MRPPNCWNFFEDSDVKTPHVLRYNAQPQKCYIDQRIEKVMEDIQDIGFNLSQNEQEKWRSLTKFTIEIFIE